MICISVHDKVLSMCTELTVIAFQVHQAARQYLQQSQLDSKEIHSIPDKPLMPRVCFRAGTPSFWCR